jgi:Family of unknown function (DUF5995)
MKEILAGLARADGVACFTRLYLAVTEAVQAQLSGVAFENPELMARLDVHFAGLFFDAVEAAAHDPAAVPRAWAPLLDDRGRKGIAPLQFALAGMNAHINRDLPVALVTTCREAGVDLDPQHPDFLAINSLLAAVEPQVKAQYVPGGFLRRVDRLLHRVDRLDDVVAMWDVDRARDAAWANAEAMWAIRDDAGLSADFLAVLDRSVGLAGRGLLIPADTFLQRLDRRL